MTKADPLIAAFRQIAAGKISLRPGPDGGPSATDDSAKADFRDQLRSIARGTKADATVEVPKVELARIEFPKAETSPRAEIISGKPGHMRGRESADDVTEAADEATTPATDRADQRNEMPVPKVAADVTPSPQPWRGPEASLSAVISRLDQAQTPAARDDAVATHIEMPEIRTEPREASPTSDDPMNAPKTEQPSEPRFKLAVDTAETRALPTVKVVVREQETHFEPVQQLTLLQKIVDRMVTDLPAVSPRAGTNSAEAAPLFQATDKPVKILTLELDPPNLGAVTVKMRLIGNAVELHLSADRQETMQMLQRERGTLTDVMQSAGYAIDIAAIDHSRASDANPGAGQQQAQSDPRPSQQAPGGSQIDNATSERQSGEAQSGPRHNRQQHEQSREPAERPQNQEVVRNRNGGPVYL